MKKNRPDLPLYVQAPGAYAPARVSDLSDGDVVMLPGGATVVVENVQTRNGGRVTALITSGGTRLFDARTSVWVRR